MIAATLIMFLIAIAISSVNGSKALYDKCNLGQIGKALENDKVLHHKYHHLYCKEFMPFINGIKDRPIRMLEIGFGCGHHNHGTSAIMWNKFFTSNDAQLQLYEVDLKQPSHEACAKKFLTQYPPGTIVEDVYLGDQGNKDFMRNVVEQSGGKYDLIIDDGGHRGPLIRNSFEVLWDHLVDGGVYIIEDLGMMPSKRLEESFVRDILGWQDQLTGLNFKFPDKTDVEWTKFPSVLPKGLVEIHCRTEICALVKENVIAKA